MLFYFPFSGTIGSTPKLHQLVLFLLLLYVVSCCVTATDTITSKDEADHNDSVFESSTVPVADSKNLSLEVEVTKSETEAAALLIPKYVELDYRNRNTTSKTQSLTDQILDSTKSPTINDITSIKVTGYGSLTNWTAVTEVVRRSPLLEILHWENRSPMSKQVIQAMIDFVPDCKLHYDMSFSNWDPYDKNVPSIQSVGDEPQREGRNKLRAAIIGSRNLYSLKADISYGHEPDSESVPLIHKIVTNSLNLRKLDLSIHHEGCVVAFPQPYLFDFSSGSGLAKARFPPLEHLKLSGYGLDERNDEPSGRWIWPAKKDVKWPYNKLPQWVLSNMIPPPLLHQLLKPYTPDPCQWQSCCKGNVSTKTNLDGWLQRMDWSSLTSLDIDQVSETTLRKLKSHASLNSLQNLTLHYADPCAADALINLLNTSDTTLKSLHLTNIEFDSLTPLLSTLTSHHQNLTSLHIHENEDLRRRYCDPSNSASVNEPNCQTASSSSSFKSWYDPHLHMTPTQLSDLTSTLPNLTDLLIDLPRDTLSNTTSRRAFISAMARTNVQTLGLRFESPSFADLRAGTRSAVSIDYHFTASLSDPDVNATALEVLFRDIRLAQRRVHGVDSRSYLQRMTVYIGSWERKDWVDLVPVEKVVLGRYECVGADDEHGAWDAGDRGALGRCKGGVTWPCFWGCEGDADEG